MVPATDSASMTPARLGCDRVWPDRLPCRSGLRNCSSFRQDKTPTLGSVAQAQPGSSQGVEGDLYADRQRPNLAKSREALALSQAKGRKPAPPVQAGDTATLAKASETPAAPEESSDSPGTRPVQVGWSLPSACPGVGMISQRQGHEANDPG